MCKIEGERKEDSEGWGVLWGLVAKQIIHTQTTPFQYRAEAEGQKKGREMPCLPSAFAFTILPMAPAAWVRHSFDLSLYFSLAIFFFSILSLTLMLFIWPLSAAAYRLTSHSLTLTYPHFFFF